MWYPFKFSRRKVGKGFVQQGNTLDSHWVIFLWQPVLWWCWLMGNSAPWCCFTTHLQWHTILPAPPLVRNLIRNSVELMRTYSTPDSHFLVVKTFSKLPPPWRSNHSQSSTIDWQFSCLCCFSTNGISLCSGKAEKKHYRDQGRLTFLAPLRQTPPHRIALLFVPVHRLTISIPYTPSDSLGLGCLCWTTFK